MPPIPISAREVMSAVSLHPCPDQQILGWPEGLSAVSVTGTTISDVKIVK